MLVCLTLDHLFLLTELNILHNEIIEAVGFCIYWVGGFEFIYSEKIKFM